MLAQERVVVRIKEKENENDFSTRKNMAGCMWIPLISCDIKKFIPKEKVTMNKSIISLF